ncbi:energy transducer TonB [Nitratiruptor sp. YY09-18]|uniref:energy transducer TonB n=1 Tax=Nitratiruptor sp. YY09-18 TaxID=2724901 RepID=UPI0019169C9C|nr:energy transducer TonB [Nitratiruptor sp. YY09-18]BCD68518.1 periplasmic protein TonB [Nitratiruptor sp. YY09-18]
MKRAFFITLFLYTFLFFLFSSIHFPIHMQQQRAINIADIKLIQPKIAKKVKKVQTPKQPKEPQKKIIKKPLRKPKKVVPKRVIRKAKREVAHKKKRIVHKARRKRNIAKRVAQSKEVKQQKSIEAPPKPEEKTVQTQTLPHAQTSPHPQTPHKTVSYAKQYLHSYIDQIRIAILHNRYYPRMARKLHRQGVVKVAFTLLPNGKIEALHVVQSSGYKILDKAAMSTIKRAAQEFPKPHKSVVIEVPIEYRLK